MYLDYEFYKLNGGSITDLTTFNKLNRKAQHQLDWYTFNRLQEQDTITDEIKMCLIDIIDYLDDVVKTNDASKQGDASVKSVSNNGISVTYNEITSTQANNTIKEIIYTQLTNITVKINSINVNLLYRGVL